MLPDIQPGNTKILYFFNCLLDGMHTISFSAGVYLPAANQSLRPASKAPNPVVASPSSL